MAPVRGGGEDISNFINDNIDESYPPPPIRIQKQLNVSFPPRTFSDRVIGEEG